MRKVTRDAVKAFLKHKSFRRGNMSVTTEHPGVAMYLHGNLIAYKHNYGPDYLLTLRDAGWRTVTTKERLNGLLESIGSVQRISQRDFIWYFGKVEWTGSIGLEIREASPDRTLAIFEAA